MIELRLGRKELRVGRIGTRIAALDVIDAEIVQHRCNDLLVVQREVDAVGLRAVAQCRVEQIKALFTHEGLTGVTSAINVFFIVVLASHSSPTEIVLRLWPS